MLAAALCFGFAKGCQLGIAALDAAGEPPCDDAVDGAAESHCSDPHTATRTAQITSDAAMTQ